MTLIFQRFDLVGLAAVAEHAGLSLSATKKYARLPRDPLPVTRDHLGGTCRAMKCEVNEWLARHGFARVVSEPT